MTFFAGNKRRDHFPPNTSLINEQITLLGTKPTGPDYFGLHSQIVLTFLEYMLK